jgi:thioredoxin-related protein
MSPSCGIESDERSLIVRGNIRDRWKITGTKYGFLATPTFILFDRDGNEVWRSIGSLDREKVKQFMDAAP